MTRVKIVRASEDLKHYAATIYRFPENYKGFQALFNENYSGSFVVCMNILRHTPIKVIGLPLNPQVRGHVMVYHLYYPPSRQFKRILEDQ